MVNIDRYYILEMHIQEISRRQPKSLVSELAILRMLLNARTISSETVILPWVVYSRPMVREEQISDQWM
jgi:hypothetical protein